MRRCGPVSRRGPFGAVWFTSHAILATRQSTFSASARKADRRERAGRPASAEPRRQARSRQNFLETAPTTLPDLQRGAATNDRELIAGASHILSASGAAVGAVSLAARCKELEAISRT